MRIIIKNSNECELDIPTKYGLKLYDEMSVRHPNAFYLRRTVRGWDGMVHFVSKYGKFKIGMLPRIYELCKEWGLKPKLVDLRPKIEVPKKVCTHIGDYRLRPEQIQAIDKIIHNKIGGCSFQVGVIDATVNFGKSLLMAALYYTYGKKLKTLLITGDADWLQQAKEEFKQYVPDEKITFIQGSKVQNWSNFSIGMVQSISRNIKNYQNELAKIDMVLVDEADLAGSKTYQTVITHLYNTKIRLGLSGTIYMSKLAKDKLNNWNLEAFFGKVMYEFRLADSIKKGYSTKTIVKLIDPSSWYLPQSQGSYNRVYEEVVLSFQNLRLIQDRLIWNLKRDRIPALVVCKFVNHCEIIYKYLKRVLDKKYTIEFAHVNTPNKERNRIMKNFREGKLDILISTTIIARGKNIPSLKYLINAAGMNSQEKNIQFLGRLVRTHKSKNKVYLDDIQYQGDYLSRHSRRRARYYKQEKLKVIDTFKTWKKYKRHAEKHSLPF